MNREKNFRSRGQSVLRCHGTSQLSELIVLSCLVLFLCVHHPRAVPPTSASGFCRLKEGFRIIKKLRGCESSPVCKPCSKTASRFTISDHNSPKPFQQDVCSKLHIDPGHHAPRANLNFEQITSSLGSKRHHPNNHLEGDPPSELWDEFKSTHYKPSHIEVEDTWYGNMFDIVWPHFENNNLSTIHIIYVYIIYIHIFWRQEIHGGHNYTTVPWILFKLSGSVTVTSDQCLQDSKDQRTDDEAGVSGTLSHNPWFFVA